MLRKSKSNCRTANLKSESSRKRHNILFGITESQEDDLVLSDNSQKMLLSSNSSFQIQQRQPIYKGDDGRLNPNKIVRKQLISQNNYPKWKFNKAS